MNWRIIKNGIGWSREAWCQPLKLFAADNPDFSFENSLEIGASECGTLAPFLLELSNKVTVGYYQCDLVGLKDNLNLLDCEVKIQYVDMTKIDGKYDLIIAKSVLGGIFREGKSSINDVNEFINNILENNIKSGGGIVSIR